MPHISRWDIIISAIFPDKILLSMLHTFQEQALYLAKFVRSWKQKAFYFSSHETENQLSLLVSTFFSSQDWFQAFSNFSTLLTYNSSDTRSPFQVKCSYKAHTQNELQIFFRLYRVKNECSCSDSERLQTL